MNPGELLLAVLVGVALGLPLPLLAWAVCWWKRTSRWVLCAWITGVGIAGASVLAAGLLTGVQDSGQHSSAAGLARFAYTFGVGACQLLALVLVTVPAVWLQGRRQRSESSRV